jgi:hypothetical protein
MTAISNRTMEGKERKRQKPLSFSFAAWMDSFALRYAYTDALRRAIPTFTRSRVAQTTAETHAQQRVIELVKFFTK